MTSGEYQITLAMTFRGVFGHSPRVWGFLGLVAALGTWLAHDAFRTGSALWPFLLATLAGVPALWALLIVRAYRKLKPEQRKMRVTVGPEAIVWADAQGNQLSLAWPTFKSIVETSTLYFLYPRTGGMRWVPTSAFSPEQREHLRALIAASGVEAKLLRDTAT